MLEDVLVIGLVMAIMELVKTYVPKFPKEAYFIPILILAGGLNALNAYYLGEGMLLVDAVAEGIKLGAAAAGIFGLGKAALGKS